jgi:hypothetical protein
MSNQLSGILKGDVYAGISGIDLDFERMDLGEGIVLSKTAAHVLAPYMVVFDPNRTGGSKDLDVANEQVRRDPDGSRWVNVTDKTEVIPVHREYAIAAQLYLPAGCLSDVGEDRFLLIRWIVALLRIWSAPTVSVPIIGNTSLDDALETNERLLFPFETEPRGIQLAISSGPSQSPDRLAWVRDNWKSGLELANRHHELRLAIQAIDQSHFVHDWALGVLLVWAAIEGLFSPSRSELQFRISALIASYLEVPGSQRHKLYKQVAKLYGDRSVAAHGRLSIDRKVLFESIQLLRRIIIKMISESRVPSKDDLEVELFGG